MPNWAKGIIKIRGTQENIKNFLINGLKPQFTLSGEVFKRLKEELGIEGNYYPLPEINEIDNKFTIHSPNGHGFYIKNTYRAFINKEKIEFEFKNDNSEQILSIDSFKQAWSVDTLEFVEISKKYHIDIKIYAWEKGNQFNQDIEIHKGEIIKDETIKFENYEWEAMIPCD